MGNWNYIAPEGTTNYIANPSFENNITDSWAVYATGAGAGNRTHSSATAKWGVYSMLIEKTGGAAGDYFGKYATTPTSVNGQEYIASCWVNVGSGCTATMRLQKAAGVGIFQSVDATQTETTGWVRIETAVLTANATGDAMALLLIVTGTPTVSAYFDGVQVELADHTTTYCDGDQPGCEWNGAEHNSTSTRSALSRAGGVVTDFEDLNFEIGGMVGAGMSPIQLNVDQYAILPGGELNSQKTLPRTFTLTGIITGTSLSNLHANRESLIEAVASNYYPGNQPLILRYTGATTDKEIAAYYMAGLEGNLTADYECYEMRFGLRFLAADPNWYEIGNSAAVLDSNDSSTLRYMTGRLRSTGQWDDLNLVAPTTGSAVYTVLIGSDNLVYVGGDFTGWDGAANRDYVAVYDPSTDTWATWGAASDFNSVVYCLIEGPDGNIYAGGSFTNCHGVAAADYIAVWDGSAWAAVGTPVAGTAAITDIRAMCFDSSGNLYIGGDFTDFANVANADYLVMWDGTSYSAIGSGGTGAVYTVEVDDDDNLYIGGLFTNWAADADADYLAWWDGSSWAALGGVVFNNYVEDILYDSTRGLLYISGFFTNVDSIAEADYIVAWNGNAFSALNGGLVSSLANPNIAAMSLAPDGVLYAVGYRIESAGGIALESSMARWNGSSWLPFDLDLGVAYTINCIDTGRADPVANEIYEVYVGFTFSGTSYYSGTTTVTNGGTESAYPQFEINRSGGTSATLIQIRNETTGKEIVFSYALLDGETLTINLEPTNKYIQSSFFGNRLGALLVGSDFGVFNLQPGDNQITCFVAIAGAPTVTATMQYKDSYWSSD